MKNESDQKKMKQNKISSHRMGTSRTEILSQIAHI